MGNFTITFHIEVVLLPKIIKIFLKFQAKEPCNPIQLQYSLIESTLTTFTVI